MTKPGFLTSRLAFAALWGAVGVQLGWSILNAAVLHLSPGLNAVGIALLAVSLGFAALHQRSRWPMVALRLAMGAEFLLSVADRFGLLGAPGQPGVSWGDFPHFVTYTGSVVAFLPGGLDPAAAIGATALEIALGLALLLGLSIRRAAVGAGLLLAAYAASMTISLPMAQQFHYDVILLCAAMLALATVDAPVTRFRRPGRWSPRRPNPSSGRG